MEQISWDSLAITVAVVMVVIGIYNTVSTAMKNRRDQIKSSPLSQAVDRIDKHDQMLAADKRRIENLEEATNSLKQHNEHMDEGLMVLMRSTLAMSRHMQHGNNINGLRDSDHEITDYLTNK